MTESTFDHFGQRAADSNSSEDHIEIELCRDGNQAARRERDSNLALAKARLGARIVRILDEAGLSIRQAELRSGISYVEFSRIRQGKLRRFTIDRLMSILECLGEDVEVSVTVHPREARGPV